MFMDISVGKQSCPTQTGVTAKAPTSSSPSRLVVSRIPVPSATLVVKAKDKDADLPKHEFVLYFRAHFTASLCLGSANEKSATRKHRLAQPCALKDILNWMNFLSFWIAESFNNFLRIMAVTTDTPDHLSIY